MTRLVIAAIAASIFSGTVCTAVWPPEHRADWLMASYDRYAAAHPKPVSPVFRSVAEPISCPGIALTQGYGPTTLAGEPVIGGVLFHTGWDLACPEGTPVYSVTTGIAHVTSSPPGTGFGESVQIHAGSLWVRYGHLLAVRVRDLEPVVPGTPLGLEGSTGFSTGPHLHFEVDRGCSTVYCSIDPANLISLPAGVRR